MPPKQSKYVLNVLAPTKQHGVVVSTTDNAMYALFGFMNDQGKAYKIFQRVQLTVYFKYFSVLIYFDSYGGKSCLLCDFN